MLLGLVLLAPVGAARAQGFASVVEDAWLTEAAPGVNHGGDPELQVKTRPGESFRAVIRFDLSGVAPNANVTAAEAWFRVTGEDKSGMPVNIHAVTDSWSEMSVNWSNTGNDYDAGTVYGSFSAGNKGWAKVDITPLVQAWVCGEIVDNGLMLIATSSDTESKYASREWSSRGQRSRLKLTIQGTNPCADEPDHFVITHDSFGIHCLAETLTVRVEDAADNPITSYAGTVTLDTQSGRGSWVLLSGSGTLTDVAADDGLAEYQWASGESEASFALQYPEGDVPLDVDVYQSDDPSLRDTDAEGPLVFSASGFMLTAAPLSNPPPGVIAPFDRAQTAAVPFTVYLAAYGQTPTDPLCGIIENYTGTKSLKFWSSYVNPGTGTRAVEVDANPVATAEPAAASQAVDFTGGQAAIAVSYKDVGSLQLAVKDDTTVNAELPQGIRGATAAFVSRPARFELSGIADASGSVVNPAAVDHTGDVFIAAGAPFRVTVTALDADGDATPNYGRENVAESVRLEPVLVAPAGGQNPAIGAPAGFGAFAGGTATGTDFAWPEVGIIRLRPAIADGDYLGTGDVIGSESVNVGRFIPADFALALNVPSFTTQCSVGSFTYTGQPFGYAIAPTITATALAVGGTPTLNYTGVWFRMSTDTLANRAYSAAFGTLDTSGVPSPASDPVVSAGVPGDAVIVFGAGSGLAFARAAVEAPFAAEISLSIDVIDGDGVAASGNPAIFGAAGGIDFSSGREIRYGRIRFTNAVGSELVDLPVPLIAEFYGGPGTGFVRHTDDSCTTGLGLTLGPYTENLDVNETCVLDSGAPGASGAGCPAPAPVARRFRPVAASGDFNLILKAPGTGNHGGAGITATVPDWLRYDWNAGLPGDENPTGQATFGLYGGETSQIYLREIY